MKLIIFGPQGSGKGTQAKILSKKLNIPHLSTGEIFRRYLLEQTDLGKQIKPFIDSGQLVPDNIVDQVVAQELIKSEYWPGFILDGYPRTVAQAEFLSTLVELDHALEIALSDDEAIRRISARRHCPKCQADYNLLFKPPKFDYQCDKCQTALIQRDDDRPEAISQRLKIYHQQAGPLKIYYKNRGIYTAVDGAPAIEIVAEAVVKALVL